jgi:hypothetical protein
MSLQKRIGNKNQASRAVFHASYLEDSLRFYAKGLGFKMIKK